MEVTRPPPLGWGTSIGTPRAGFRPVGAPGQAKLWGPQYHTCVFMEANMAHDVCSEASEP